MHHSTVNREVAHAHSSSLDDKAKQVILRELERILKSQPFRTSGRSKQFLSYVVLNSLDGRFENLKERTIGVEVFQRDRAYATGDDPVVRVNAGEVRRRLEQYYYTAPIDTPVRIEIPIGSYAPEFCWTSKAAAEEDRHRAPNALITDEPAGSDAENPAPAPAAATRTRPIAHMVWALVCVSLAIACLILIQRDRSKGPAQNPWRGQPAVAAFWTAFLDPHLQTDVVLPDDSASVVEDITKQPIAFGDYLSRGFERQIQSSDMSIDRKTDVYEILKHNLVTLGAVRAAQLVLEEMPSNAPRYLAYSRDFTADDLKRNDVVLIGGHKAQPWDYLFDGQLNFVTDYDYVRPMQVVRNRAPKPGEQPIYGVQGASGELIGYATVAYLPNPSRTGHVIILAGTDSDATDAAAAFLTSEEQMERLRNTLQVKRFPYFEVLLRASRVNGTFFASELIAFRMYPNLQ
jgi:hypothetical protein